MIAKRLSFVFFVLFLSSCAHAPSSAISPSSSSSVSHSPAQLVPPRSSHCIPSSGSHSSFTVFVDGVEVGREVRTDQVVIGPFGDERLITSHAFTRMKMGSTFFDKKTVHTQRTEKLSGRLLRSSFVSIDQVETRVFLTAFNGRSFERLVETKSSVTDPPLYSPSPLDLEGEETIGFRLHDILRDVALGKSSKSSAKVLYYEPLLDRPLSLFIGDPLKSREQIDGKTISGFWTEASREDSSGIVIRAFFDDQGTLWKEEYPEIHQFLERNTDPLSFSLEPSELNVGLYSDSYISNPNSATRATFHLSSPPDRLDSLSLLGAPLNQSINRISPNSLELIVHAGAPDGQDPPTDLDLGTTKYIQPKSRDIIDSLRYLRSAGKSGRLSKERRYNATSVIARSSLIKNPKSFWRNPEKVAGLILSYVHALLPDKRHTYSMSDSVTTLKRGAGDCTEHAVLFAALMRAAKIPTRLVTGMHLTRGGLWVYHMWNSFWNGKKWRAIDPGTMAKRPGALHVALGRATPRFEEVRDRLSDFMWKTFSGVSFNLVEASNNGELLLLSKPRKRGGNPAEVALLNAVVLSERGDHAGAISIIDENFPRSVRPVSVRLMRVELLVLSDRCKTALEEIPSIRLETSDTNNLFLLDNFELSCLLKESDNDGARSVYQRMDKVLENQQRADSQILLKSQFLFGSGNQRMAIDLLGDAIGSNPRLPAYLKRFSLYVSSANPGIVSESLLSKALSAVAHAAWETHYADRDILRTWARLLISKNRLEEALWLLDHALILAPDDQATLSLREAISSLPCTR